MNTKYHVIDINIKKVKAEERRRKRILRRRIKNVCNIVGAIAFSFIIGLAGSLENDIISMGEFIVYEIMSFATLLTTIRIKELLEE